MPLSLGLMHKSPDRRTAENRKSKGESHIDKWYSNRKSIDFNSLSCKVLPFFYLLSSFLLFFSSFRLLSICYFNFEISLIKARTKAKRGEETTTSPTRHRAGDSRTGDSSQLLIPFLFFLFFFFYALGIFRPDGLPSSVPLLFLLDLPPQAEIMRAR